MQATEKPMTAEKNFDKKIEIDTDIDLGESLENGFDALGKVFGGLVGAIKDAVGPEVIMTLQAANWLGQLTECLQQIVKGLDADEMVPAEPAGQFSFLAEQFNTILDGSKLESQKPAFGQHLQNCQQAISDAADDAKAAATVLNHSAGYFKAAAASCVPVSGKTTDADS
ncbi:MAG: hypothetical protein ABJZ55_11985 [Fuerstiella sp.]